jgi:hypothetical protein
MVVITSDSDLVEVQDGSAGSSLRMDGGIKEGD